MSLSLAAALLLFGPLLSCSLCRLPLCPTKQGEWQHTTRESFEGSGYGVLQQRRTQPFPIALLLS